jgi:hypothetical protein
MKPKYTEKEQQAINGVMETFDSLPGYRKQLIFFNGQCVGYKYEKLDGKPERLSTFRSYAIDFKRMLKWNW